MKKIKIIFSPTEEKPYIVIWKPKDLPSAPLTKEDKDNALSQAGGIFPEVYNVHGRKEIEYGLLHRLDTATDGILVIAVTQNAYDFIINEQKEGRFIKYYTASCHINFNNSEELEGFPPFSETPLSREPLESAYSEKKAIILKSYFRGYGKGSREVRPVTENCGRAALKKLGKLKEYRTDIFIKELYEKENKCTVECRIAEGYRHQVRCHLAWAGLPIENDKVYNSLYRNEIENDKSKKNAEKPMKFSATKIEFEYPRGDLNSYEIALTWT